MVSSYPDKRMTAVREAWYVVGYSSEVPNGGLLGRRILGEKYTLYRTREGQLRMVQAACPHRGADLSRGRVVRDCLRCPMHGWEFDGDGKCRNVPSQPEAQRIPYRARLAVVEIREQQGLIWAWFGEKNRLRPVPVYEEWEQGQGQRRYLERPRLWKCSFANAVENAIDETHAPFMHRLTLGEGSRQIYPRQDIVLDEDGRGFWGRDAEESPWGEVRRSPLEGGLVTRFIGRLVGAGPMKSVSYRFDLGGSVFYKIEYENGTWEVLVGHCTPASESETWFFAISVRTRALHFLGDVFQKWFARTLMDEDQHEVEAMLSNTVEEPFPIVSVVGDEPLLVFRRLWERQLREEADVPRRSASLVVGEESCAN